MAKKKKAKVKKDETDIQEINAEATELTNEEVEQFEEKSWHEKEADRKISKIIQDEELDETAKTVLTEEEKKLAEAKRRKKLRNEITHRLRFTILQRDNFTCIACGRSPKTTPGLALEVDHIKEIDMGGTNDLDNLQTLCWECNEGKKGLEFTPPKREYDLKVQKIKDVAEISNFEEMKHFLYEDANEEERQWLYQMHEDMGSTHCIRDCKACVDGGEWFFRRCFVQLHQHINVDQLQVEASPQEVRKKENIVTTESNALLCDFCYISKRCPKFKVGASCAFDMTGDVDFTDIRSAWQVMLNVQKERVLRAAFFEKRDGGAVDKNLSTEIALMKALLESFESSSKPKASFTISGEGSGKEGAGVVASMMASIFGAGQQNNALPEASKQKALPEATEVEPIVLPVREQEKVEKK